MTAGESTLGQSSDAPFERVGPTPYPFEDAIGILQDHRGYIWVADNNHLYKFDGSLFERNPDMMGWRTSGMTGGRRGVICVFSGQDDPIFYDTQRMSRYQVDLAPGDSLEHGSISSAHEDLTGQFWFGTERGLIFRFRPGSDTTVFPESHDDFKRLWGSPVTSIIEDTAGFLWIAGTAHLLQVDSLGAVVRRDDVHEGWKGSRGAPTIAAIARRTGGGLWLLTDAGELGWLDLAAGHSAVIARMIPGFSARAMFEDFSGDVWIVTERSGVYRWSPQERQWSSHLAGARAGAPPAMINDGFLDREGNVWIASSTHGLLMCAHWKGRFHSSVPDSDTPSTMAASIVNALWKDSTGILWAGTASSGLSFQLPGSTRFGHLLHDENDVRSLSNDHVVCIRERRNGEFWIGTLRGINVLQRASKTFVRFSHRAGDPASLGSHIVLALYEDRQGTLWIGHDAGIDRFVDATRQFAHVSRWPAETLGSTGSVTAFFEDASGRFWVATRGRGLFLLDREKSLLEPVALPWTSIHSICEHPQGTLWMGANDGLAQCDPATLNAVLHEITINKPTSLRETADDPGPSQALAVFATLIDGNGMLWLTTSVGGIVRFDPQAQSYDFHGAEHGVVVSQGRRNAFFRAADGTIYCGGVGGITSFHPDRLIHRTQVPPIVAVEVKVFQEPLPLPHGGPQMLNLEYWEHTLTIGFSMLDFVAPDRCRYEYVLEGAETEWTDLGNRNSLMLVNMSPGEYVLRVRGANSEGIWNREGIALAIAIRPPFWVTWWFRSALLALVVLALYGLYRYRVSQLRALERLRVGIANDLHDDIGSELSAIALDGDLVARKLPAQDAGRDRIVALAKSVRAQAENLRDVVWIMNPEQDRIQDLVVRMRTGARQLLPGVEITFQVGVGVDSIPLEMEFKRNLHLMFKEIAHNIAKHAQATAVHVKLEVREKVLSLCVADNGVGFDPSAVSDGHGLRSLCSRAQRIGGSITLESKKGLGTKVCCQAKIRRL